MFEDVLTQSFKIVVLSITIHAIEQQIDLTVFRLNSRCQGPQSAEELIFRSAGPNFQRDTDAIPAIVTTRASKVFPPPRCSVSKRASAKSGNPKPAKNCMTFNAASADAE
jgi:hypothetical protein